MSAFRLWLIPASALLLLGALAFSGLAQETGKEEEKQTLFREDTRLIDRRGRIVSLQLDILREPSATEFDRSVFVSIDDEQSFRLLENFKLQELESITRRGEKVVKVWGTLSTYRGENYLLITRFRVVDKPRREREEDW